MSEFSSELKLSVELSSDSSSEDGESDRLRLLWGETDLSLVGYCEEPVGEKGVAGRFEERAGEG